jgi:hypothetical protein
MKCEHASLPPEGVGFPNESLDRTRRFDAMRGMASSGKVKVNVSVR